LVGAVVSFVNTDKRRRSTIWKLYGLRRCTANCN